ncbi:MAG: hypothetical protein DME30_10750 [Verrucomicrobia bacterium]|nr:MAG: hypothetical protein DME30_10750 [Verrucomicrobiota bacterium]
MLGVGALVLILLIPLLMITGVLTDRLERRNEAVADITSSWGKEQSVIGPVLGIPYQYKFKAVKEMPAPDGKMERREVEETAIANAYFLPETLNVSGDAQTQMLHRGIYAAAVFRAQMKLSGRFAPPDFGALKIDVKDVQWKDAFVTIAVNDTRFQRERGNLLRAFRRPKRGDPEIELAGSGISRCVFAGRAFGARGWF